MDENANELKETKETIEDVRDMLTGHITQYNLDMNGDKNSDNGGRRGLINNVRANRKYQRDYPSITWLLAHRPIRTWATIVLVFVMLSSLMAVGLLNIFGAMFGVTIPIS